MQYKVVQDLDPYSPRENECFGTIAYVSNRYTLGDHKVSHQELEDIMSDDNNIGLNVYAYIHGGITMNTTGFSCSWDSGQSGYIYVSKEDICGLFGVKSLTNEHVERAKNILKAEIEEFDHYLNGEMYGYIISDDDGNVLESCYGFFGREDAESEAQIAFEYFNKKAS